VREFLPGEIFGRTRDDADLCALFPARFLANQRRGATPNPRDSEFVTHICYIKLSKSISPPPKLSSILFSNREYLLTKNISILIRSILSQLKDNAKIDKFVNLEHKFFNV
jgi:hypothetical protein